MNVSLHQIAERSVNAPMPRQQGLPAERDGDDAHAKMAAAIARTGMAGMFVALVFNIQFARRQLLQARADTLNTSDWSAHGNTLRSGRTSTWR